MTYVTPDLADKILRTNPDIVPFGKMIPENERRDVLRLLLDPNVNERAVDLKVREILPFLEKVNPPIVKVYFPGTIHGIKSIKWDYDDEKEEEPNLLFDHIIGHKAICFNLENLLGTPYLYLVVRYKVGTRLFEDAYQVDITREVCLMKPDFISTPIDKETGRSTGKSHRLIKFRKGWLKVYGVLYYSPPGEEKKITEKEVLLLTLEVEWKRYGKPSGELVRINGGRYEDYVRIKRELGRCDDKHLFGVVHYRVKVRDNGVGEGDIVTNVRTLEMVKKPVQFGHQTMKIIRNVSTKVDGEGWKKLQEGVVGEVRLEPFKHKIVSEVIVKNKKTGKYYFTASNFEVYRRDNGYCVEYVVLPKTTPCRFILYSSDHWDEGWGRVLVELREGEGLLFTHLRPVKYQFTVQSGDGTGEEWVWSPFEG